MAEKQAPTVTIPGLGLAPMLTVLFVGLKLTGHIDWSWVWVWSPMWITALIALAFLAALTLLAVFVAANETKGGR